MLNEKQKQEFKKNGYIIIRDAIEKPQLAQLLAEIDRWVEDSRAHTTSWGKQPNGKPRFDLESGHNATTPKIRRIANPADISDVFKDFAFNGPLPDYVADLIGPNVKFHHCKLNFKMPGMAVRFDYHQDHAFAPHTNDDMITCLLPFDPMNKDNGCVRVVPGSQHQQFTHYHGKRWAGCIDSNFYEEFDRAAEPVEADVGDICLMHTWLVHCSAPNNSNTPRRLFVADYAAADAFPFLENSVPSIHQGHIVRGNASRVARLKSANIELPEVYREDSYFELQDKSASLTA